MSELVLYHGTTSLHLKGIQQHGLTPQSAESDYRVWKKSSREKTMHRNSAIYLGTRIQIAEYYANHAVRSLWRKGMKNIHAVVLRIRIPEQYFDHLRVDDDFITYTIRKRLERLAQAQTTMFNVPPFNKKITFAMINKEIKDGRFPTNWKDSLAFGQIAYEGNIPHEWISVVAFAPSGVIENDGPAEYADEEIEDYPLLNLQEVFLNESISVELRREFVGGYSDQSDMRIDAMLNGVRVGYLAYSIYQGEISIQFVMVQEKHKKQGIARQMFEYLIKEEGVSWDDISHGMQTPEGFEMFQGLNKTLHNPKFEGRKLRMNLTWYEITEIVWELMDKVDPTIKYDMDWADELSSVIGEIRYKGSLKHQYIIKYLLKRPEVQKKLEEVKP